MNTRLWFLTLLFLSSSLVEGQKSNGKSVKSGMIAHLPVHQNEFVSVFMGSSPGRMLTLRVEREQNETVVLFQPPSDHTSKTFVQYDAVEGNELMFVGSHSMRVPVTVNPSVRRTDTKVEHDGTIGLGKQSELWRYWSRFTLSSSDLVLGVNDRTLERKNFKPFELELGSDQIITTPMKATPMKPKDEPGKMPIDKPLKVHFRPTEMHTGVPSELFYQLMNNTKDHSMVSFMLHLPSSNKKMSEVEIKDDSGDTMLRRNPNNQDDHIVLGCGACRNFVWHTDRLRDTHIVAPAYDAFDIGNTQPWFNAVTSLIFILLYYFWYAIAYTETVKEESKQGFILNVLENYLYKTSVNILYIMHQGFKIERFVEFQVSYTNWASYLAFVILLGAFILAGFVTISFTSNSSPRYLIIRKVIFEFVLTGCFWMTQLETHYNGLQQVFLIAIASIHAISRTISFVWCFADSEPVKLYKIVVVTASTLIAHWFLIFFNIIPFVSRYWYGFPSQWSSVLLVWLVCTGFPSFMVFFNLISAEISNDFIELETENKQK